MAMKFSPEKWPKIGWLRRSPKLRLEVVVGRLEVEGVFSELSLSLFLVTLPFTVSPVFWHK